MRVGIYAGTFDPVHKGHINLATCTLEVGNLDAVYFLLEHRPRHKPQATDYMQRLEMLRIALSGHDKLRVLDFPDDNISIKNTLPRLRANFPEVHLSFVIGSDVAMNLKKWPDLQDLLADVDFIIGLRPVESQAKLEVELDRLGIKAMFIKTKNFQFSSRQVREQGKHNMINPKVLDYIKENNLYI
jgi:nicotinate-nucleotide adenylyltransferase